MIPGFTIIATQTQPTRPGKAPRPVWNVTCPPGYEDALYALGGRQWRGQFSFWSDPTEDIESLTPADRTSVADRESGKRERAAARSERLAARAAKHSARSRELVNRAVDMTKCIPMGQPILVGHHSEGRHRNLLKRSDNAMRRGVEAGAYADHLERRSAAAARQEGFHLVSKLRGDADLRFIFTGVQKPRGAPRKYDGKVDLTDVSRLDWVREIELGVNLYTQVVWWMTTRTQIRIAYLRDTRDPKKVRHFVLCSTDPTLDAETIHAIYRARFQIEFLFHDGKQFAGLADCQARSQTKLDFHFNASLTAVNVAKLEQQQALPPATPLVFSLDEHKRKAFNRFLLDEFISNFGLDADFIKNHPNFEKLIHCGFIAA